MSTQTEARDAINMAVDDAWTADPLTTGMPLHWDNVAAEPPGEDANGNPLPWARVSVRNQITTQETISGGAGKNKHQTEGALTVQIFTAPGDGHALSDQIVEVLKTATRNVRIGDLYFFSAGVNEIGMDQGWWNNNFVAEFRYEETN